MNMLPSGMRAGMLAAFLTACLTLPSFAQSFVHPGITLDRSDLDLIKWQVAESLQPQTDAWTQLQLNPVASLTYVHHARAVVECDQDTCGGFLTDANALWADALQWYVTGDVRYAQKTIEIMNAWSSQLTVIRTMDGVYSRQHYLCTAWAGHHFAEAAEIIRNTYTGWAAADITQYETMLKTKFYPNLPSNTYENGNWEASIINSILAIGIFTNDRTVFDRGVAMFRGTGRGAIGVYVYASGECQETCRDQVHVQVGLGELMESAEMAWKQGVDLYSELPDAATGLPRLALGMEYTAKVLCGIPQPCSCGTVSAPNSSLQHIWEVGYNHYHNRVGFPMTYSELIALEDRPAGAAGHAFAAFQTVTHGGGLILNDSFTGQTTGALPARWTVTNQSGTTCTIQPVSSNQALRFTDVTTTGRSYATRTFPAQSGQITARWKFKQLAAANRLSVSLRNGGTVAMTLLITDTLVQGGTIPYGLVYRNAAGQDISLGQPTPAATWYEVTVVARPSSGNADIYVNGVLKAANVPFQATSTSLDRILLLTDAVSTGTVYFDDVFVSR